MGQNVVEVGVPKFQLLPACEDDHEGVIVDMKEPMDPNVFQAMLKASLSQWKLEGKKGAWIKLPIGLANLVEIAVKEGFWYHHAEPQYLMLAYWIPDTLSAIPANATHQVRIGAIVMNDKRELLVVREKIGRYWGTGIWKIPTGILEEGEDIFTGATREVKEETGINTEFVDVIAFRQKHRYFFGKSDLIFLCMLQPLSFDIHKQDSEIEEAQWMPLEEYADQPVVENHCIFKHIKDICLAKIERGNAGWTPLPITSLFNDQISYLYMEEDLKP
ncbi:nudix hydrolase 10-like isoform X2 [Olea europaea var. sylvestris]|uniref:Nudix hydrolase 10-like n=1 Tax=Olea europaea subsp. europaea TaxID=158383 RepID=A0A8S0R0P0_OLEEU|nr:nudix hydrolase 10-like isoform X2 [Olea europaea var. sylvestris]CAA2972202.1 nudix hydrolase 10-like [Olea europaea subsp. europaea]